MNAEQIAEALELCEDDPDGFNEYILGRPSYWSRQVEICDAIAKYETTVVESGNSIGKSFLAAGIVLWWLYTRPGSLVVTTAPSQTLLATVLFKEIRRAHKQSRVYLPGKVSESANASPQTLIVDAEGHQVLGIATRGVERLSGQHAGELLQVIDEASGLEPDIWEALDSQNPTKRVVFGNPLRADGPFVDLARRGEQHNSDASIPDHARTKLIIVPSTDSPDITQERSSRGLADAGFLRRNREKYGEDSLWWRTHIEAKRPTVSAEGLLPEHWLDFASKQVRPNFPGIERFKGITRLGCDLGEGVGRDKTVIVVRDNLGILEVAASNAWGLPEAASEMKKLARKYGVKDEHCSYDALGIGRDLTNHLQREQLAARPYRGSATVKLDFANMRSLSAWKLRQRLDPDRDEPGSPNQKQIPFSIPRGPWWPQMRTELLELRYELVGQKTKLESKEDLLTRLGHSPDFADALMQTFSPL